MFIGHYAIALAAKNASPKTSLGTLFIATQLIDLLWPVLLLLGLEHVRIDPGNTAFTPLDFYNYPITHSLVGALGWAVLVGAIYFVTGKNRRGALVVGGLVFSHWLLDLLTHRPDLPLAPGSSTHLGLGLWNSVPGTIVVELGLFIAGIALYLRTTAARNRTGTIGFWLLMVILTGIWVANIFGPPPPDATTIAVAGNGMWLFVLLAYWIDRNRVLNTAGATHTT